MPWRRAWQPTPVFWTGESHGQRNLVGYSPCVCKQSDITEQLSTALLHFFLLLQILCFFLLFTSVTFIPPPFFFLIFLEHIAFCITLYPNLPPFPPLLSLIVGWPINYSLGNLTSWQQNIRFLVVPKGRHFYLWVSLKIPKNIFLYFLFPKNKNHWISH